MFYIIFRFCDNVDVKTLPRKQSTHLRKISQILKFSAVLIMMVTFYRLRFFIFVSRLPWQLHYLYMYIPSNKFTVSCCFYARVYLCMECKGISDCYQDPCIKFRFLHEIGIPYHFFTRRNHFFVVCNIRFLLTVFVGKNVLHRTFLIGNSARN